MACQFIAYPHRPSVNVTVPFNALLKALGGRGGKRRSDEVILYAFDLLYVDGHDLQKMELSSRRHLLGNLIGEGQGAIRFSEEMEGDGQAFFDAACEYGLEGIVGKRAIGPIAAAAVTG